MDANGLHVDHLTKRFGSGETEVVADFREALLDSVAKAAKTEATPARIALCRARAITTITLVVIVPAFGHARHLKGTALCQ